MTVGEVERAPPAAAADCDASATEGGWKENGDSYEGPVGDVGSASMMRVALSASEINMTQTRDLAVKTAYAPIRYVAVPKSGHSQTCLASHTFKIEYYSTEILIHIVIHVY